MTRTMSLAGTTLELVERGQEFEPRDTADRRLRTMRGQKGCRNPPTLGGRASRWDEAGQPRVLRCDTPHRVDRARDIVVPASPTPSCGSLISGRPRKEP
jgi:hypothetical protein